MFTKVDDIGAYCDRAYAHWNMRYRRQKKLVPAGHMRRNGPLWINAPNTFSTRLHFPC